MDALAFVVAALVLSRLPAVPPAPAGAPGAPRSTVLRDRRYVLVTALHTVLPLHMPLLGVIVPLWTACSAPRRPAGRWRPCGGPGRGSTGRGTGPGPGFSNGEKSSNGEKRR
ncbi:hypothetical protein [Streptomyces megasporus]|uniref:hypothetical protein n=1 Tax=Streptomyces megasporus TaxID=44060 RepID=UPI0012FF15E7|nr:hypothetical protein [Streptomyces megasporus]